MIFFFCREQNRHRNKNMPLYESKGLKRLDIYVRETVSVCIRTRDREIKR